MAEYKVGMRVMRPDSELGGIVTEVTKAFVHIKWDSNRGDIKYSPTYIEAQGWTVTMLEGGQVLSLFSRCGEKPAKKATPTASSSSFDDIAARNAANKKRQEEDRKRDNARVTRANRLKKD